MLRLRRARNRVLSVLLTQTAAVKIRTAKSEKIRSCFIKLSPSLPSRVRRYQIVRPIVDYELTVVLGAVLDRGHPNVGIVDKSVSPRHFHRFVQPGVAALESASPRPPLLAESTSPRRLSSCNRLATGCACSCRSRPDLRSGSCAHQVVVNCATCRRFSAKVARLSAT